MTFMIENKEEYFQHLTSLPVAIVVVEIASENILYINPMAEELWMYKAEDLVGHSHLLLHPTRKTQGDQNKFHEDAKILHKENFVTRSKNIILRADGHEIPVELSVSMINIEDKEALVGTFVSIEKREVAYKNLQKLEHTLTAHNERLHNLLNNINGISWEFDLASNRFTYVSSNVEDILGYKHYEWADFDSWKMMIHPEDRQEIAEYCMVETKKAKDHTMEYRMLKKDGSIVWVLDIVSLGLDAEGVPITLYGFILDITKQKTNQLQLEYDKEHLQNIVNSVPDPIMVIKEDYNIELMNTTLTEKLPYLNIADSDHPKCYEISHGRSSPCDGSAHPCPLAQVMQTNENTKVLHNHKDLEGRSHYVEIAASPLLNEEGACVGIIESARDVTKHLDTLNELKAKSTELDYQAHHDTLTGLPNRTLYHDRIDQAIQKAKRLDKKFTLFFIDLDHFKEVNDSLGHDAGDRVLLEATKRLKECLRAEDTLSRLGGDEFTVLIENVEKVEDISRVAQNISDTLREPFMIEGRKIYLSCSIGISSYPEDSIHANDLLKFADNAMYKAKNEGRDNFQFYSKGMTALVFERIEMEANIRKALKNDEFRVYYQPQYNAKTEQIIGMEALIRWKHPSRGLLSPMEFIPLAEKSSLIIEVDNWVMQSAMKQISTWYKKGLNPGVLSLNLAIKQLESPTFIERLQIYMNEADFQAQWLKLELLERDVMQRPQESVEKLQILHKLGVELAIDDFGTGQSSLTYLKRFPLDQLKIDHSFVEDIHQEEEDNAIVTTIIALAKALKLDVIAEGVETKEQLDFLLKNGCENIQGYYLSRPVEPTSIEKLLHH